MFIRASVSCTRGATDPDCSSRTRPYSTTVIVGPAFDANGCCNYNVVLIMADVLGSFEQAVLLSIIRLDDGAYGRAILNEVAARLERDIAAGAVQATLERL